MMEKGGSVKMVKDMSIASMSDMQMGSAVSPRQPIACGCENEIPPQAAGVCSWQSGRVRIDYFWPRL